MGRAGDRQADTGAVDRRSKDPLLTGSRSGRSLASLESSINVPDASCCRDPDGRQRHERLCKCPRLWFLGDVFALPARLPLANVFSVGDLLIGLGMIAFIILSSTAERESTVDWARLAQPFRIRAAAAFAVRRGCAAASWR